jgi:short-subunit dehydrogenase
MAPEAVAKAAVDAAENGKRAIVPGLLNRAGALTGQHVPRVLALPIAKRLWRRQAL